MIYLSNFSLRFVPFVFRILFYTICFVLYIASDIKRKYFVNSFFSYCNNILCLLYFKHKFFNPKEVKMDSNSAFYEIRGIENFRQLFEQSAALFPARPAFRLKNEDGSFYDITYPALLKTVRSLSQAIVDLGLLGKKIAVMGKNSFNWCCTYLAVTCGVGVIVPIDKELPPQEIANIINISGACAVFFDDKEEEKIVEIMGELSENLFYIAFHKQNDEGRFLSYNKLLDAGTAVIDSGDDSVKKLPIDKDALSVLLFTSGTTGLAKGVMLSQNNICSDIMMLSGVVRIYPEDVLLSILPLHHTYEC